jgi:hypothetical protein
MPRTFTLNKNAAARFRGDGVHFFVHDDNSKGTSNNDYYSKPRADFNPLV